MGKQDVLSVQSSKRRETAGLTEYLLSVSGRFVCLLRTAAFSGPQRQ